MTYLTGVKSALWLVGLLCLIMNTALASSVNVGDENEHSKTPSERINGKWVSLSSHQETQTNMEYLLLKSIDKLQAIMNQDERFTAFGAALFLDGQVKFVWYADQAQDSVLQPLKGLPFIRRALQTQAESNRIIGSAVIYPVGKVNAKTEQLNAELEYYNGYAQVFASEYSLDHDKAINWGRSVVKSFTSRVFSTVERIASQ